MMNCAIRRGIRRLGVAGLLWACLTHAAVAGRAVRAIDASIPRGQTNCIAIVLEAAGDELHALLSGRSRPSPGMRERASVRLLLAHVHHALPARAGYHRDHGVPHPRSLS